MKINLFLIVWLALMSLLWQDFIIPDDLPKENQSVIAADRIDLCHCPKREERTDLSIRMNK